MQPQPDEPGNVTPIGPKPSATVVTVDPATASRWLDNNQINRSIRDQRVNQYARDMKAGQWELTGEPVKFAKDGRLLDGQHRLWAIVVAEVTLTLFVVRGLEADSQSYMDTGAARTAGDALSLNGETNAALLAAAARLGIAVDTEARGGRLDRVSNAEVFEWINAHPGMREAVASYGGKQRKTGLPGSVLGYCAYRFSELDPSACEEFITGLATHVNLPERSPILALSTRLATVKESRITVRHRELLLLMFRTWNHWRMGRGMKKIQLPRSDDQVPRLV